MEDTRLPKCVMFGELNWSEARVAWGARKKKSGWGVSWTTSDRSASTPTSGRLQPETRGNGAGQRNKRGGGKWIAAEKVTKPGLDYTACSGMPERDRKDQGEREDIPKQADSCWFARHNIL